MISKKEIIIFVLGGTFANLLLGIRMYNPVLLNEALFYITNYKGLYFFLHSLILISLGGIAIAILILIEYWYKKKNSESVHKANKEEDK